MQGLFAFLRTCMEPISYLTVVVKHTQCMMFVQKFFRLTITDSFCRILELILHSCKSLGLSGHI